ncbi:SxtJ family membrane protein [Variovorax sp. YR752]|uniref:SxtJ family membrane protein n=1 Tax=Variovorax sp. YR752 TaxID=1884383 RepID=UPI003137FC0D
MPHDVRASASPRPQAPGDRSFGVLFTAVFALLAAWAGWRHGAMLAAGLLAAVSLLFGLASAWRPALLGPLNRAWMALGHLLGRLVSPVVLGVLFYGVVTPVALVQRLAGRDELRLRLRRDQPTHWQPRDPPGPGGDSFGNQF